MRSVNVLFRIYLAEAFEPTEQTIRNWLKQADRDDGDRSDGPNSQSAQCVERGAGVGVDTTRGVAAALQKEPGTKRRMGARAFRSANFGIGKRRQEAIAPV
jgi:hypothetical protein